ncbi:MAG: hypothetical protein WA984_05195, partial [Phormidesmis sp.]
MASGPYQSNVLRFFVGQYRQGLNRHCRAVDQTRSNIALGAELGVAVALVPVYAALRTAQGVRHKLTQSIYKLQLAATRTQAKKLIDFSPFKGLSSAPTCASEHESKGPEMTPVVHSADGFSLALARETAEVSMLEILVAVGDTLLPDQINSLAEMPTGWGLSVSRGRDWIRWLVHRLVDAADDSSELATARSVTTKQDQITGVASDLETRSLVLVLGQATVWPRLSLAQQAQLQSQISRVFGANNPFGVSGLPTVDVSTSSLAQPIYSFWIAVLRTIGGLQPRHYRQPTACLLSGLQWLTGKASHARLASNQVLRLMETSSSSHLSANNFLPALAKRILPPVETALPSVCTDKDLLDLQRVANADAHQACFGKPDAGQALEANVISVDYVE